ncbi:MAG: hypothetical protein JWO63_992 [Frankiales bacterium]|nr:hypothetical protein [Frankiales bacterium]
MTSTLTRSPAPPPADPPPGPQSRGRGPAAGPDRLLTLATVTVAAGALLTMLPLRSVFTDWNWLVASVGCALPYILIVTWARFRGRADVWPVVLGLVASFLLIAWVFIPQHLLLGVIPTPRSLSDLQHLLAEAHQSMQAEHAPVASTPALRLLTSCSTVLLVALTDVLGVLWRKPLLASAPLLEVLAVASATSAQAAGPVYFVAAAAGFLLILLAGTRLQDRDWGPSVDGSAGRLGGARWMAVTGIAAALIVPLALPSASGNLLARATHHNGDGSGSGGGRVELNNTADLSGSLRRGTPVSLLQVHVSGYDKPFYIRQVVLDQFTRTGWVQSAPDEGASTSVAAGSFPSQPDPLTAGGGPSQEFRASFTVTNLGGSTLPVLANPTSLNRVDAGDWDPTTSSVFGVDLAKQGTYFEDVSQPDPTADDLRAAPAFTGTGNTVLDARYLSQTGITEQVAKLAQSITAAAPNEYDKAQAISNYFTDPKNGFVYSVDTAPVVNNDALQSFLDNKRGYCQQFAAAAAVLMRAAGVPSRVVLGYTHQPQDDNGDFTVTTADAHAWVEVYFTGIGWVPFDPTPLGGADAARAVPLPYETHATAVPSAANSASDGATSASASRNSRPVPNEEPVGTAAAAASSVGLPWTTIVVIAAVLALLLLVLLGPQLLRRRQRRRRLRSARATGDPEPLWQELTATAVDHGSLWPETITVGQVPGWLSQHGVDERGTATATAIARQVELVRYSGQPGAVGPDSVTGLSEAMRRWGQRAERRERLANWWLPRSVLRRGNR